MKILTLDNQTYKLEKIPEYVRRFDEIVRSYTTEAGYYGHASVGCLHIRPVVNLKDKEGIKTMEKISAEVSDLVLEFGGSLSGEHGDGIVRGAWAEKMFGADLVNHIREVKSTFDPKGIMNPKKIFDTTPLTDLLRGFAASISASACACSSSFVAIISPILPYYFIF